MVGLMALVSHRHRRARLEALDRRRRSSASSRRSSAKLLFVLFIAAFLADRIKRIEDVTTPLLAIGLAVPPVLLVFLQPDLGSGLVYLAALGACLFVAGIRWLHLASSAGSSSCSPLPCSGSCRLWEWGS